ncbi:MAG: non-homologous end-joining DNA ligase LigD [Anaerolineae bacterium]
MPLDWLVDYWEAKAELALPFLTGRASGMQLVFGKHVVFRRHEADGSFIFINTRDDLLHWAHQHCYSFHPHLENGTLYFALDIDRRSEETPLELVQLAAGEMASLLDALSLRYLLKFSGSRGFHFFWGFAPEEVRTYSKGDVWGFERRIIHFLRRGLEERLQAHPRRNEFLKVIPEGHPITATNSADKSSPHSLLLDENIVHELGSLRSPWSVHPESGLVSLPLDPGELATFTADMARPEAALSRGGPTEIPMNGAAQFVPLIAGL